MLDPAAAVANSAAVVHSYLPYRQALALQRPIDAITQGSFYGVLIAESVSSVLYTPGPINGT
jgi:hypothetical protein